MSFINVLLVKYQDLFISSLTFKRLPKLVVVDLAYKSLQLGGYTGYCPVNKQTDK